MSLLRRPPHHSRQTMSESARIILFGTLWDAANETTDKISGYFGPTSMMTSQNSPGFALPVLSTRLSHPAQSILRGRYQRNHIVSSLYTPRKTIILGTNGLIIVNTYFKYPCIHTTSSTLIKATVDLLKQVFAHFCCPYVLVMDNVPNFALDEFQERCREHGIAHLSRAPYHPATNGAAKRSNSR